MLDTDSLDRAKQACLKQSFGAELSAEEQRLLGQFLASAPGQKYQENSDEMKRLLGDVAEIKVASIDSSAMLASFESRARNELRAARRRLPLTLLLTSGIGLLTGSLGLLSSKDELVSFSWVMLGFALLCAILFVAIWRRQGVWLNDPDLLMRMREEREAGESKSVVIVAAVIGLLFLAVLGVSTFKAGGVLALGILAVVLAVVALISLPYHRRKQLQDQELWDWWDGRSSEY